MNRFAAALGIANAVLYERRNEIRWQFGVLAPKAFAGDGTGGSAEAQTEILFECAEDARLAVLVRFLQVEARCVEAWTGESFESVESLSVGDQRHITIDEGIEREVAVHLHPSSGAAAAVPIAFSAEEGIEPLWDGDLLRGRITRRRWPLHGAVAVECEALGEQSARRLRVRIENHSAVVPGERSCALRTAFVSAHTLLHAERGRFFSIIDPPPEAAGETGSLRNLHMWPVLIDDALSDAYRSPLVLSSPVILGDFPVLASAGFGDAFDARATDPFDALDVPAMDCVFVDGTKIGRGSVVRLHPKRRADVWDAFLEDRLATVRAIQQDVENQMYVAVTVDDDPASEMHDWYGRSLFFYPDEVEPVP